MSQHPHWRFLVLDSTSAVPQGSKDYLLLNVLAPAGPAPVGGRSVLFWIYGGDLDFGYKLLPIYDSSVFAAEQDFIVVSTNYPWGIFGFPNLD
jgi:carboxylesterase type B